MKLNIYCSHCQALNSISDKGILDRKDLEHLHGNVIKFSCDNCSNENSRPVRLVFASESKSVLLICTLLGLAFIGVSVLFLVRNGSFIIWPLFIGVFVISAGFISNNGSNSKHFNKS